MQNFILLHGALGSSDDLAGLSRVLKMSGNTVFSFSFSGHGKQAFQTAFGIEQFASELENFVAKNEIKNPIVFGYSMGGFVALHLAAKHKNFLKKIITLGTKFNWSKESVEKETRMLNPETMLEKIPGFAKGLENKHGAEWKELVTKTADMMREIHEKNFLNPDLIKSLEMPVLLGLADNDQMVSLEETRAIVKELPGATMYMLPKSKHAMESVDVNLLAQIIFNFVAL